jgi:hypothetical protein
MRYLALVSAVFVSATVLAVSSVALARSHHRAHSPRGHFVTAAQPSGQIACTVLGCQRIPPACTPVPGRTWSGLPTGYDVIVCPPGVSPF